MSIFPLVAAGGNSRAARSARAKLQFRDRFGRWVEMGRGVKWKYRDRNGVTRSVIGSFIGAKDNQTGQVYVHKDPSGLPDGFYDVKSNNAQEFIAHLSADDLKKRGITLGMDADGNPVGDRLKESIPDAGDLVRADAPEGWAKLPGTYNGKRVLETMQDGDYRIHFGGNDTRILLEDMRTDKGNATEQRSMAQAFKVASDTDAAREESGDGNYKSLSSEGANERSRDQIISSIKLAERDFQNDRVSPDQKQRSLVRMEADKAELEKMGQPYDPEGSDSDEAVASRPAEAPTAPEAAKTPGTSDIDVSTFDVAPEGFLVPTGKRTDDISPEGMAQFIDTEKESLSKGGTRLVVDKDNNTAEIYNSADTIENAKAQAGGLGQSEVLDLAAGKSVQVSDADKTVDPNSPDVNPNLDGASKPAPTEDVNNEQNSNPDAVQSEGPDAGADTPVDNQSDGEAEQPRADSAGSGNGDGTDKPAGDAPADNGDSDGADDPNRIAAGVFRKDNADEREKLTAERTRTESALGRTMNRDAMDTMSKRIADIDARLAEMEDEDRNAPEAPDADALERVQTPEAPDAPTPGSVEDLQARRAQVQTALDNAGDPKDIVALNDQADALDNRIASKGESAAPTETAPEAPELTPEFTPTVQDRVRDDGGLTVSPDPRTSPTDGYMEGTDPVSDSGRVGDNDSGGEDGVGENRDQPDSSTGDQLDGRLAHRQDVSNALTENEQKQADLEFYAAEHAGDIPEELYDYQPFKSIDDYIKPTKALEDPEKMRVRIKNEQTRTRNAHKKLTTELEQLDGVQTLDFDSLKPVRKTKATKPSSEEPKAGTETPVQETTPADFSNLPVEDFSSSFAEAGSWRVRAKDDGTLEMFKPGNIMDGTQDEVQPLSHIYRAVSEEDYNSIQEKGFIQSDGRMNVADYEGTVATHRDPSFYAPNRVGDRGRVIRMDYNPEDGWWADSDGYLKTPNQIPASRVSAQGDWTVGVGRDSMFPDDPRIPGALAHAINSDLQYRLSNASWESKDVEGISREIRDSYRKNIYGDIEAPDLDRQASSEDSRTYLEDTKRLLDPIEFNGKEDSLSDIDNALKVLESGPKRDVVTTPSRPEYAEPGDADAIQNARNEINAIDTEIESNLQKAELATDPQVAEEHLSRVRTLERQRKIQDNALNRALGNEPMDFNKDLGWKLTDRENRGSLPEAPEASPVEPSVLPPEAEDVLPDEGRAGVLDDTPESSDGATPQERLANARANAEQREREYTDTLLKDDYTDEEFDAAEQARAEALQDLETAQSDVDAEALNTPEVSDVPESEDRTTTDSVSESVNEAIDVLNENSSDEDAIRSLPQGDNPDNTKAGHSNSVEATRAKLVGKDVSEAEREQIEELLNSESLSDNDLRKIDELVNGLPNRPNTQTVARPESDQPGHNSNADQGIIDKERNDPDFVFDEDLTWRRILEENPDGVLQENGDLLVDTTTKTSGTRVQTTKKYEVFVRRTKDNRFMTYVVETDENGNRRAKRVTNSEWHSYEALEKRIELAKKKINGNRPSSFFSNNRETPTENLGVKAFPSDDFLGDISNPDAPLPETGDAQYDRLLQAAAKRIRAKDASLEDIQRQLEEMDPGATPVKTIMQAIIGRAQDDYRPDSVNPFQLYDGSTAEVGMTVEHTNWHEYLNWWKPDGTLNPNRTPNPEYGKVRRGKIVGHAVTSDGKGRTYGDHVWVQFYDENDKPVGTRTRFAAQTLRPMDPDSDPGLPFFSKKEEWRSDPEAIARRLMVPNAKPEDTVVTHERPSKELPRTRNTKFTPRGTLQGYSNIHVPSSPAETVGLITREEIKPVLRKAKDAQPGMLVVRMDDDGQQWVDSVIRVENLGDGMMRLHAARPDGKGSATVDSFVVSSDLDLPMWTAPSIPAPKKKKDDNDEPKLSDYFPEVPEGELGNAVVKPEDRQDLLDMTHELELPEYLADLIRQATLSPSLTPEQYDSLSSVANSFGPKTSQSRILDMIFDILGIPTGERDRIRRDAGIN